VERTGQTHPQGATLPPGGLKNFSQGKYENYQPPGGQNSQPQFKQFVSSMTPDSKGLIRESDDLLSEYGLLDLTKASIAPYSSLQRNSFANLPQSQANFSQNQPTFSSQNLPHYSQPHSNDLSQAQPTYTKPTFPTSIRRPSQTPAPVALSSSSTTPVPAIPPRSGNSSFLYTGGSSGSLYSTLPSNPNVGSSLPINSRLSSVASLARPHPSKFNNNNGRDLLSDLDPLRTGPASSPSSTPTPSAAPLVAPRIGGVQLQPPSVPPRTKKQWTTFE